MSAWQPVEPNLLLIDTAVIVAAGLFFALFARRLRQSILLGYLLAGLAIGPHGFRLVPNEENIQFLAEVGVVLLMFALGVQLSLRHLLEVKVTAIIGGLAQIILTILLGFGIGYYAGIPPYASLVLGYALALSSSVVLVRLLGDYDEFHTIFGRIALGISVMQDLMAVVLISTLHFFSPETTTSYGALSINLVKALLFVIWVIVLARWVAPYILKWASIGGSREIFLQTVVVLSLGSAIASGMLGFSYALGAFLAGIVISESIFSQAVLAEVIPLRDIFGLLFFVSLGMLVDPGAAAHSFGLFSALLLATIIGKTLLIAGIILLFRHHVYVAMIVGVLLAQIGEFSFLMAREAQQVGVITPALNSIIITVATVSIALTPVLLPVMRWLYRFQRRMGLFAPIPEEDVMVSVPMPETTPVLLCGFGRVGRTIAQALDTFRVPFLVIDIDRRAVEALKKRGINAVYGDAANLRLLERVGATQYRLGVIAVAEHDAVLSIATHLRRLNPAMHLLLRSHSDGETAHYLSLGVEGVVHVELEASLAFVREVLTSAEVDDEIVEAYLNDIRIGYYEGLRPRRREE